MGRLQFEEQLMKMILKAENTSKHKYNQSNTIKAIQSAIQSERSKRYDQQYDQEEPGGGNGYIASSTYVKTRNLSVKEMFSRLM